MESVTRRLTDFAIDTQYSNLPEEVIHESKRLLLDSIGVAFAGLSTEKGKLAIELVKRIRGNAESTIIATGDKSPPAMTAFANGELMDAMEYSALINPMGPAAPFIIPAPVAVSESVKASGKELIATIAISSEISTRIAAGLIPGRRFNWEVPGKGMAMGFPVQGHGLHIFGGAAGCGRLLGLKREEMCNALGIAGYMCPIPMLMNFATTVPSAMTKHLSAGWICQAEITSALLAQSGYSGNKEILDGEYGFWKSFGADGWMPEAVTDRLGEKWHWQSGVYYKPYPCCAAMHDALSLFYLIIDENKLKPYEIERVTVRLSSVAELPLWQNRQIECNVDAQFSAAYVFAAAAYDIGILKWQNPSTFENPEIIAFMKKVNVATYGSDYSEPIIEVAAVKNGAGLRQVYSKGNIPGRAGAMSDDELAEKFGNNASTLLGAQDIDRLVTTIFNIEELQDMSELLNCSTLKSLRV